MIAYTEKQAYNLFFKTLQFLRAKYPKMIMKGLDKPTKHQISLTNGSKIMCYAAGLHGEGIRTYTITDLVIDEAAPMKREVYVSVSPMISVTHGSIDVISTPRGKSGFFYECSKKENYTKFYVNAEDCPRHSEEHLAEQREFMTSLEYAQEYKAEFLDELRQYFSPDLIKKTCVLKRPEAIHPNHTYFYGCDVARKNRDEFTHEIIDRTNRKLLKQVENIMTKGVPLTDSARRIIHLNSLYNFKREYIDSGGMGIGVCDILRDNNINRKKVVEINNASRSIDMDNRKRKVLKEDLYANLHNLMESGQILLLDDEEVIRSLESIQVEVEGDITKIWGRYSHICEGLIRAAWCTKDKSLKLFLYTS